MSTILIENGIIIPVDGKNRTIEGKALLIKDDRIAAIDTADALKQQYVIDSIIDASGQAVMPGFVNAHTHTPSTAPMRGIGEDKEGIYFSLFAPMRNDIFQEEDCDAFVRLSCMEMLKYGTTCLNDLDDFQHSTGRALVETGMRGVLGPEISDLDFVALKNGNPVFDPQQRQAKIDAALEVFNTWHGSGNDRIRVRFSNEGPAMCSNEALLDTRALARERDVGINIHANAFEIESQILQSMGRAPSLELLAELDDYLDSDVSIVHMIYNTERELDIFQESGAWMVHCCLQQAKHGAMAPMSKMYARNFNVALGSDALNNDPFEQMRFALVLARAVSGERMLNSAYDYLEMSTIKAARAVGFADKIGSLEVDKQADIILVNYRQPHIVPVTDHHDLITSLVYSAHGKDVTTVIVDGKVLIENGKATQLDEAEIMDRASRHTKRVHDALQKYNTSL